MRNFQLFRYIKKWMPGIVLFFMVMTIGSYFILSSNQKYIATAVIHYSNEGAVNGFAPDGSEIDTSEIYSSSNMARAMENLGLSQDTYSIDRLCSSIAVTPVLKEEDVAVQEALNEQGEKSEEKPTDFIVTCTMDSQITGADTDFVRNLLNELLNVYFAKYSEEHINGEPISNTMKGLKVDQYDYLEVVEQIDHLLEDTFQTLNNYVSKEMFFRSATTGYSFHDLRDDFQMLRNVDVYRLYSLILGNQITKDEDLLVSKYLDLIARHGLTASEAKEDLDEIDRICDAYIEKLRSSGNTNINYRYILEEVYDYRRHEQDGEEGWYVEVDHTVEYDTLLRNRAAAMDKAGYASIDVDYCLFVLDAFGHGEEAELAARLAMPETVRDAAVPDQETAASETVEAKETAVSKNTASRPDAFYKVMSSKATAEDVEAEIDTLMARMNELFDIADRTNEEYNEYLGAQNIQTLSSVSTDYAFSMVLYMSIIAVTLLLIGCGIAVLLGRGEDVLEYMFLRDHQTGCMNRAACDHYISKRSKDVIPSGFCCVNLQILNQREVNRDLGRKEGDKILETFGRILREVFENRDNSFVGYNGSGQFLCFFEMSTSEESLLPELERLNTVLSDQVNHYPVAYALGGAYAMEVGHYQIRALLSEAVNQRREYVTVMKETVDETKAL